MSIHNKSLFILKTYFSIKFIVLYEKFYCNIITKSFYEVKFYNLKIILKFLTIDKLLKLIKNFI